MIRSSDPIAKKIAMKEHERSLQNFDRFNEDFVTQYMSQRQLDKGKKKNREMDATKAGALD